MGITRQLWIRALSPTGQVVGVASYDIGLIAHKYKRPALNLVYANREVEPHSPVSKVYQLGVHLSTTRLFYISYDAEGRLSAVTDSLGHATQYSYDSDDRVISTTIPDPGNGAANFISTASFDNLETGPDGQGYIVEARTDYRGQTTKIYSDINGRIHFFKDALGNFTAYSYNTDGKLLSISDANGNAMSYIYDGRQRVTQITDFNGKTWQYSYNSNGSLNYQQDPKGQKIWFSYDNFGRTIRKCYGGTSCTATSTKRIEWTFTDSNKGQNIAQVTETLGRINDPRTTAFLYFPTFLLNTITTPEGRIDYSFTAGGQIQGYTLDNNSSKGAAYSYFQSGAVKEIKWLEDTSPVSYTYNLTGARETMTYPDGMKANYSFDNQGRQTSIAYSNAIDSPIVTYSYNYDEDPFSPGTYPYKGLITSEGENNALYPCISGTRQYSYDAMGQLTQTAYPDIDTSCLPNPPSSLSVDIDNTTFNWSYDAIGNRLSQIITDHKDGNAQTITNYQYQQNSSSKNSQLLASLTDSSGITTFAYDNNGNLSTMSPPSVSPTTFTWNEDDKLISLTSPSGNGSYAYDFQGNRIQRIIGSDTWKYLYNENSIIKYSINGLPYYVNQSDEIDKPSGYRQINPYFYLSDMLGSVQMVVDSTLNPTQSQIYGFSSWGEITFNTGSLSAIQTNPFAYTGREWDIDNLYFYRARYYMSEIGSFLSKDPLNDVNLIYNDYTYAENDPISNLDPLGLTIQVCCRPLNFYPLRLHCYIVVDDHTWGLYPIETPKGTIGVPGKNLPGDQGGNCAGTPDCPDKKECIEKTAKNYPRGPYAWFGTNSNTFAGTIARTCGLSAPPHVNATGWDKKPPQPIPPRKKGM